MNRVVCRGSRIAWTCSVCGAEQTAAPSATLRGLACDACLDRGYVGEPFVPLTVRMVDAKAKPDVRPVVAVDVASMTVLLEDGETFDLEELPGRLLDRESGSPSRVLTPPLEPAIVVTDAGVDLLAWLEGSECAEDPFWQWQVALTEMSAWRPEAKARLSRSVSLQPRAMRFGFASRVNGRRRAHGRARWYQIVDVHRFAELPDGWGEQSPRSLLTFGVELREWCNRVGVPVGSSGSTIGARLLRDSRFGRGWRRKVPAATNDRARRMLPGNHYQLLVPSDRTFAVAHKWDMARAHHWAALTTVFPHPDLLDAHGYFRHAPDPKNSRGPIREGSREWGILLSQPGLFVGYLTVPERVSLDPLALPLLRRPGGHWTTFSGPELAEARAAGAILGDIWAAWTSLEVDERLNEYSYWAQGELQRPGAPRWLKPTLLSAYGLLAARAREYRSAWRWTPRSAGGVGWTTSHGLLEGMEIEPGKPREPQATNVVWRVLIERAVRQEALRFARELRNTGHKPLAVYADAVFAREGRREAAWGPLKPPWRYEGVIHDLTFDGPSRYRSREETRLPGTPRRRDGLVKAI